MPGALGNSHLHPPAPRPFQSLDPLESHKPLSWHLWGLLSLVVRILPMQEIQEMWVRSLDQKDLEKEMATHSSILGWEISWTEEPGDSLWGCKELDMTQSLNNNNNKTILQGSNHIITGLEAGAEDMGKSYG